MTCRICTELEEALLSARQPGPPHHLLGLSAAGMRNRVHQQQEHLLKSGVNLEKHRKSCLDGTADRQQES